MTDQSPSDSALSMAAQPFRLRSEGPRVARLSRTVLIGGTALAREAALFLGVTEEDIKNRTNRFLGYASALVEKGQLPPLTDFMNK